VKNDVKIAMDLSVVMWLLLFVVETDFDELSAVHDFFTNFGSDPCFTMGICGGFTKMFTRPNESSKIITALKFRVRVRHSVHLYRTL